MEYSLPIDSNELENVEKNEITVDMSKLNFQCNEEKQIRSCFLFLRNTNLKANMNFNNCLYNMKESYLLFYMNGDMDVNMKPLTETWIDILIHYLYGEKEEYDNSILNKEEIKLFIDKNKSFIDEIYRFIISLPLVSMSFYFTHSNKSNCINMDDFEKTDYEGINLLNFSNLLDNELFILLINPINDVKPLFYTKYFDINNNIVMNTIINKLPYLSLLNVFLNDETVLKKFIENINSLFKVNNERSMSDE